MPFAQDGPFADPDPGSLDDGTGLRRPDAEVGVRHRPGVVGVGRVDDVSHRARERQRRTASGHLFSEVGDRDLAARVVGADDPVRQIEAAVLMSRHAEDAIVMPQKQPDNAHRPGRRAAPNHLGPAVSGQPRGIRCHVDDGLVVCGHPASVTAEDGVFRVRPMTGRAPRGAWRRTPRAGRHSRIRRP